MKTAALEVIKYYCLRSSTPWLQKLLEPMRKHKGQSQAQAVSRKHTVASTGSSRKHTSNAHAHTNHNQCTGSTGHGVLPGSQLKK